jgi:hypothetical protein
MQGKSSMKLAFSFSTRRIRLGVAHHGAPAPIQPIKAEASTRIGKPKRPLR